MIEVLSAKQRNSSMFGSLKEELIQEIKRSGGQKDWEIKPALSFQHVWSEIDRMSKNDLLASGIIPLNQGYGERFLREHISMQAQLKRIVDQINIELNL
jgi:hypothetical protein